MDIETLIEEGARALWKASALNIAGVRDLDAEWGAMSSGDRDPYITGSRAVLAIALAEAADEDAALTKGDLLLTAEPDLQTIYLQPRCCVVPEDGRLWCEDPQEPCSDCGAEWIAFDRRTALEDRGNEAR